MGLVGAEAAGETGRTCESEPTLSRRDVIRGDENSAEAVQQLLRSFGAQFLWEASVVQAGVKGGADATCGGHVPKEAEVLALPERLAPYDWTAPVRPRACACAPRYDGRVAALSRPDAACDRVTGKEAKPLPPLGEGRGKMKKDRGKSGRRGLGGRG